MNFEKAVLELFVMSMVSPGPIGRTAKQFLAAMQRKGVFDMAKLEVFADSDYEEAAQAVLDGVEKGLSVGKVLEDLKTSALG